MTSKFLSFAQLPDDELLAVVKQLAAAERCATAALLRSLMELDTRRLYLGEGYSSLFTYCTQALHLAEGAAYNRIEAARAARRFPAILAGLEEGALTLTAVRLLAPHLTTANHEDVLASARHKGKRDIEQLVAALHPRPAIPAMIRKQPQPGLTVANEHTPMAAPTALAHPSEASHRLAVPPVVAVAPPRAVVAPLAPERYKVQLTISRETHEKLRRVQALVRHAIPTGDPAEIFDRALTLLLHDLERRRCSGVAAPRTPRETVARSRHIPAAVKREVWRRDDGRCAYVGRDGRCMERSFLEYHHVQPYAAGGMATVGNIQLRCRSHNAYEATLFLCGDAAEPID